MPIGRAADHLHGTFTAVAVQQGCGGDPLLPREHLPMLETFLGLTVRGVPLASSGKGQGSAQHPVMHRTALVVKKSRAPKVGHQGLPRWL